MRLFFKKGNCVVCIQSHSEPCLAIILLMWNIIIPVNLKDLYSSQAIYMELKWQGKGCRMGGGV